MSKHLDPSPIQALKIRLPVERTRDTALYYPIRHRMQVHKEGQYPALVKVARDVLGRDIQMGDKGHSPVISTLYFFIVPLYCEMARLILFCRPSHNR